MLSGTCEKYGLFLCLYPLPQELYESWRGSKIGRGEKTEGKMQNKKKIETLPKLRPARGFEKS
ncbi:hypothetical protein Maes01_01806 [Microbulbifer aestuariivivens]|uniref:Uncharacterized protein n=1 Tax=Microbulbifer aestuariivivens TaxID=1908308 RepID=A0ABP9WPW6_9GAMM